MNCLDLLWQDALRESPSTGTQSPEVTSKSTLVVNDEVKETVKNLTEKLSAALVNISAKEDLVQQHGKVAEEAVAGNDIFLPIELNTFHIIILV